MAPDLRGTSNALSLRNIAHAISVPPFAGSESIVNDMQSHLDAINMPRSFHRIGDGGNNEVINSIGVGSDGFSGREVNTENSKANLEALAEAAVTVMRMVSLCHSFLRSERGLILSARLWF